MKINSIEQYNFTGRKIIKRGVKNAPNSNPQTENNKKEETLEKDNNYAASLYTAKENKTQRKTLHDYSNLKYLIKNFNPESKKIYDNGAQLAKNFGNDELELWHIYLALLMETKQYIQDVDAGLINPDENTRFRFPYAMENIVSANNRLFSDKETREKANKVVDEHIKSVVETFAPKDGIKPKKHSFSTPAPSKQTIDDLYSAYSTVFEDAESDLFLDNHFYIASIVSQNNKLSNEAFNFSFDLRKELMVSDKQKEKHHLDFYDEKADTIWKNLNLGNDVISRFSASDPESSNYLISSFTNLINKPGKNYKNINPEKTDIYVLNDCANCDFLDSLANKIKTAEPDKEKTSIIVANLCKLISNSGGRLTFDNLKTLKNEPVKDRNLRFVFTMDTDSYLANTAAGMPLKQYISDYSIQTLPSLSASDATKQLTDENGIEFVEKETKKRFSPETIQKAIELTTAEEGNYPQKATSLLSNVAKFYIDKDDIEPKDVEDYIQETKKLDETQNNNDGFNIIYDTGKKLSDIVGSPMTKADAQSIVNQIKTKKIGTKGFSAYLENGSSYGGGRRHTAEAIAGEAGIPMIIINAKDFALKDIDALSQNADLSELKIKKIVSNAIAQAEANENKTSMIFIENFDNFGSDPIYGISSIYEQKAFSQLLAEMENARKNKDVNLVVVGSVNIPDIIDPNIMKPYKFLNTILVYPPQDKGQRKEVLDYYIDKMGLDVDGKETIDNIAEATSGFTVVDLMYLLETVDRISNERQKDKIDSSDFTEAYLQTISGRPNTAHISDSSKKITASHEAGHALNSLIMSKVAQKQNIPWHVPDKLSFITLDPRGSWGGATFFNPADSDFCYENLMSELVSDYGGHSVEKGMYKMGGSFGITGDMQNVDRLTRLAVLDMGMGKNIGAGHVKRCQDGSLNVSENKLRLIEEDIDFLKNIALNISDMIYENYKGFISEFTDKYWNKVGTGECIIPSETFKKELNDWIEKQPESKKAELEELDNTIIKYMEKGNTANKEK